MSKLSGPLAVAAIAALSVLSPAFAVTYQAVAVSGQQAPGLTEGVVFGPTNATHYGYYSAFPHMVSLNNAGQIAVKGYLEGPGVTWENAMTVWTGTPGNLSLVAQTGQPTPGVPGETLTLVGGAHHLVINDEGEVAYYGSSRGSEVGATGHSGLWWYGSTGLKTVALEGQPVPDSPEGTLFGSIGRFPAGPMLNSQGEILFRATTSGPAGSVLGYYRGRPGDIYPLDQPFTAARMSNSGKIAGMTQSSSAGQVVWMGEIGSWLRVAGPGDPAPGAPQGAVFTFAGPPGVNDAGQLCWSGGAASTADGWTGWGLWVGTPGDVEPMAVTGQPAPGFPEGTVFKSFDDGLHHPVNAQGKTAFVATVGGPGVADTTCLWIGSGQEAPTLVARMDQALPGSSQSSWSTTFAPSMNAAGQVVFNANSGVWATDPLGNLIAVVKPGQVLTFPSGESISVGSAGVVQFDGSGGQDGLPSPINDAGWVAFTVQYGNKHSSSSVFTADTNVPGVTAGILKGVNQRGEVAGQAGEAGHVVVMFPVAEAGILKGYYRPETPEALFGNPARAGLDLVPLALGSDGRGQFWDLSFTGSFSEDAILELTYDESLLPAGLDESLLAIYHEVPAGWELLPGSVNPLTNTLTVTTDSFCNFALGIVPEPGTLTLLLGCLLVAMRRRRGAVKSVAA